MAEKKVLVCQSSDCTGKCSGALFRDLEDLCFGSGVAVEQTQCLDHCGKGPNIQIVIKGKAPKIIEKIDSFKVVEKILKSEVGVDVKKLYKQVAEIKYEIRRSKAKDDKLSKIDKAFKALGGEEKAKEQEPQQAASILILRAKEAIEKDPKRALSDAEKAAELDPLSGQAVIIQALAHEKLGNWEQAEKAAGEAIAKGEIRDGTGIQRRTKDKLKEKEKDEEEKKAKEAEEQAASLTVEGKKEAEKKSQLAAQKKKAAAEAKKKAEQQTVEEAVAARAKAAEDAKKAEEEAARTKAAEQERFRLEAEAQAKAKAEEEERRKLEEEERRKLEEQRRVEEAHRKAEDECLERGKAEAQRQAEAAEQVRLETERLEYEASFQGRIEAVFRCCSAQPHHKAGDLHRDSEVKSVF